MNTTSESLSLLNGFLRMLHRQSADSPLGAHSPLLDEAVRSLPDSVRGLASKSLWASRRFWSSDRIAHRQ